VTCALVGRRCGVCRWLQPGRKTSSRAAVKNQYLWRCLLGEVEYFQAYDTFVEFWRIPRESNARGGCKLRTRLDKLRWLNSQILWASCPEPHGTRSNRSTFKMDGNKLIESSSHRIPLALLLSISSSVLLIIHFFKARRVTQG
jgi:hypothetical protein